MGSPDQAITSLLTSLPVYILAVTLLIVNGRSDEMMTRHLSLIIDVRLTSQLTHHHFW